MVAIWVMIVMDRLMMTMALLFCKQQKKSVASFVTIHLVLAGFLFLWYFANQ